MSESAVCSNFLLLLILFRSPRGNILSKNNFVRFLCIVERNYVLSIRPLKRSSFRINTHIYRFFYMCSTIMRKNGISLWKINSHRERDTSTEHILMWSTTVTYNILCSSEAGVRTAQVFCMCKWNNETHTHRKNSLKFTMFFLIFNFFLNFCTLIERVRQKRKIHYFSSRSSDNNAAAKLKRKHRR